MFVICQVSKDVCMRAELSCVVVDEFEKAQIFLGKSSIIPEIHTQHTHTLGNAGVVVVVVVVLLFVGYCCCFLS